MAEGWLSVLLPAVLGVLVVVNGATDAPASIAPAISARALTQPQALVLAAVGNLLGLAVAARFFPAVTETVVSVAAFPDDRSAALCVLAGVIATVAFALAAWRMGLPTSESHAMLAGVSGAAVAMGIRVRWHATWGRTLLGLVLSTLPAFMLSWGAHALLTRLLARTDRQSITPHLRRCLVLGAGVSSFLHGAQDGQKFLALLLLCGGTVAERRGGLTVAVAVLLSLGTLIGGRRILAESCRMGRGDVLSGISAEVGSNVCLLYSTLLGLPVSTTHAKTTALMGAYRAARGGWRRDVAEQMLLAWGVTFPVCFLIALLLGFLLS